MKRLFIFAITCFTASCTVTPKGESLPDAEFHQPYSIRVNFSDGHRTYPNFFHANITPDDSGLSVSPVTGKWDNEIVISGTPKVNQEISIKISYLVDKIIFQDNRKTKFYRIKVKEQSN